MRRLALLASLVLGLSGCATSSSSAETPGDSAEAQTPDADSSEPNKGATESKIAECESLREASAAPSTSADYTLPMKATGPVATVDGEPVAPARFHAVVRRSVPPSLGSMTPPLRNRLVRDTIRTAVHELLIERAVAAEQIAVSRARVRDAYLQFKSSFPGREVYEQFLEFRNLSPDDVRVDVCRDAQFRKLLEKRYDLTVDSAEISSYYESHESKFSEPGRVQSRQILVPLSDSSEKAVASARKRANAIAERARSGETTLREAARASRDSGEPVGFSEFESATRRELAKPLREPAFQLAVGRISDPIRSPRGYFVIEIVDRKPAETEPLEAVRDRIRRSLRKRKLEQSKRTFFEEATAESSVEFHVDNVEIREGAAAGEKRKLEMPLPRKSGP